jgi:hypothetical protein
VGDGAGKRAMKCEMCTENDKEGRGLKGSGSKGCKGAEHGQTYTKDCTGAVALTESLRAALESAVQLEQGDEANRQAEMANPPTKRRNSLQRREGGPRSTALRRLVDLSYV